MEIFPMHLVDIQQLLLGSQALGITTHLSPHSVVHNSSPLTEARREHIEAFVELGDELKLGSLKLDVVDIAPKLMDFFEQKSMKPDLSTKDPSVLCLWILKSSSAHLLSSWFISFTRLRRSSSSIF